MTKEYTLREIEPFTMGYYKDDILKYEHYKYINGFEWWKEYDESGYLIHFKDSNGYEEWKEYDKRGNLIHSKDSNNYEEWYEFDRNKKELIYFKDSDGNEWWSDDNPENPKNKVKEFEEEYAEPFTFDK